MYSSLDTVIWRMVGVWWHSLNAVFAQMISCKAGAVQMFSVTEAFKTDARKCSETSILFFVKAKM